MKQIGRTTQSLAVVFFIALAPGLSNAGNIKGVLGIGGGTSPRWDESSQGGVAVGGTVTYRMHGPSVSIRLVGLAALTPMFSSYQESVSEVAVLGGWDFSFPGSGFVAFRLGLGRMSYHGGYPHALSWDYEGNAWGPSVQLDAFWKRIGITYMVHTGDDAKFSAVLICVRLGSLSED